MKNLGWLYYRDYYSRENIFTYSESEQENYFKSKNQNLLNVSFDPSLNRISKVTEGETTPYSLQTNYPGLLTGSGTAHETGSKGEMKLGFSFDYTTGLPIIPGSSVKGCLRGNFPNILRRQAKNDAKLLRKADLKEAYLLHILAELEIPIATPDELFKLEWAIFEGGMIDGDIPRENGKILFEQLKGIRLSVYEIDVFYDAYVSRGGNGQKVLGSDFITPHKHKNPDKRNLDPFVNPVPIQFLKVLPEVTFTFQFDLKNTTIAPEHEVISPDHKWKLFKHLLTTLGIGAKTNVGYGRLKPL